MEKETQRVVVKVGTSTLTHDSGAPDLRSMERLARVLSDLHGAGCEVILVFSGAIAAGTARSRAAAVIILIHIIFHEESSLSCFRPIRIFYHSLLLQFLHTLPYLLQLHYLLL